MEIILIIIALFIAAFLLTKVMDFSLMYIFLFKRSPILWIFFMFFLSLGLFTVGHILKLKFYMLFWPILFVSYFQFIKPDPGLSLRDHISFSKSTFNDIDQKNGWLKKVAGNFMFIVGCIIGYYLFYN